jgi:hypothetical protein
MFTTEGRPLWERLRPAPNDRPQTKPSPTTAHPADALITASRLSVTPMGTAPMTRALPFTQASVRRAVRAARQAGLRVTGIRPDGTLIVQDGDKAPADVHNDAPPGQTGAPASKWEDAEA